MAQDNPLTRLLRLAAHTVRLAAGYAAFALSGRTPRFGYRSLVALFGLTRGRSNAVLSRMIGAWRAPRAIALADGGLLADAGELTRAAESLSKDGYHVFPRPLSSAVCARLLDFATREPAAIRPWDGSGLSAPQPAVYTRGRPRAVRYDFSAQQLLDNADVQSIASDPGLIALAQRHLGARPVLDVVTMWWHTDLLDAPDSKAAQFFHYDMDRPAWVKFFFFLTDVGPESGPHTFVAGSHGIDGIPPGLLDRGQVRLSDQDVLACYDQARFVEFHCPAGTIVAEDTRGLHKGKHVESGDRLVLQLQYSISLFGMEYEQARIGSPGPALQRAIAAHPDVYRAFL